MGLTDLSGSYTRKLTEMKSIIESYKSTSDNLVVPGVDPAPQRVRELIKPLDQL